MMAFKSSRKIRNEEDLYAYAIGALARRMRSTAELKRLLRQRVEAQTERGQVLVELIIRRLKEGGYLNDARYAAAYSSFRAHHEQVAPPRLTLDATAQHERAWPTAPAVAAADLD